MLYIYFRQFRSIFLFVFIIIYIFIVWNIYWGGALDAPGVIIVAIEFMFL